MDGDSRHPHCDFHRNFNIQMDHTPHAGAERITSVGGRRKSITEIGRNKRNINIKN
jgi:hypothetical protein